MTEQKSLNEGALLEFSLVVISCKGQLINIGSYDYVIHLYFPYSSVYCKYL